MSISFIGRDVSDPWMAPIQTLQSPVAGRQSKLGHKCQETGQELGPRQKVDTGVNIDNAYDFVSLHNLHNGVFWNELENISYPSAICSRGPRLLRLLPLRRHTTDLLAQYQEPWHTD